MTLKQLSPAREVRLPPGATFLARCESSTLLLEIYVNVTGNLFDCVEEVEQEEIVKVWSFRYTITVWRRRPHLSALLRNLRIKWGRAPPYRYTTGDQTAPNSCVTVPVVKRWSFKIAPLVIKISGDVNPSTINSDELVKTGTITAVEADKSIVITISGRKLSVSCYGSIKATHIDLSSFVQDGDNFLELNWKTAGGNYQDGFEIQWRGETMGTTFLAMCKSPNSLIDIHISVTGNLFDCVEEVEQEEKVCTKIPEHSSLVFDWNLSDGPLIIKVSESLHGHGWEGESEVQLGTLTNICLLKDSNGLSARINTETACNFDDIESWNTYPLSDLWKSGAKHKIEIAYNHEPRSLEVTWESQFSQWDNSISRTLLISEVLPDMSLEGSVSVMGSVLDCVYGVDKRLIEGCLVFTWAVARRAPHVFAPVRGQSFYSSFTRYSERIEEGD
eukprot:sb/3464702/